MDVRKRIGQLGLPPFGHCQPDTRSSPANLRGATICVDHRYKKDGFKRQHRYFDLRQDGDGWSLM